MACLGDYVDELVEAAHEALADPTGRGRQWQRAKVVVPAPGEKVKGSGLIVVGSAVQGDVEDSFVASPNADLTARNSVVSGNNARVRSRGGNVVRGKRATVTARSRRAATADRMHKYDVKKRDEIHSHKSSKRGKSPSGGGKKRNKSSSSKKRK